MKHSVVIGAGYGDEGKGLVTDWLAHRAISGGERTTVVRFNGSAQAGHTVVTPLGQRHVFSHIGSGTFAGADTWLSSDFVCHPGIFYKEMLELADIGVRPRIVIDCHALVITPFDQIINVLVEAHREKTTGRHGSCGIGFGEAIERSNHVKYRVYARDLLDKTLLRQKLAVIGEEWVTARLAQLDLALVVDYAKNYSLDNILVMTGMYEKLCEFMVDQSHVNTHSWPVTSKFNTEHLVFEGAQGLMLDQTYGHFPHVTRSNTGLKNVISMCSSEDMLDVYYVTRAYTTRHGRGPLPHECVENRRPYKGVFDHTNITNPHQEHLRYGYLDLDALTDVIKRDVNSVAKSHMMRANIVITHLDQVDYEPSWYENGSLVTGSSIDLIQALEKRLPLERVLVSNGPTRMHISDYTNDYTESRRACA